MASVAFEHVDKVFPDGTPAVADCSLAVDDGELVVLVGPSGSGKSTVLRMVAGLEEITRGTLRIGDRVANDLSPRERNVAMVFQDYALYPHMSVRENLEFPLRMRGLPRVEMQRRVAWAADVLDIAAVLDRRPRQLSGGQQQRVAMGRALVREPAVFLLDEPLSNLDAKLRVEVRAEIAELQRRMATTMLYVTHDQTEAMTLGDRVAVLRAGRIRQVATPRELYERPADAFVAGFIGNPPMNLLPARLVRDGRGLRLRVAGETIALDGLVAEGRPLPEAEEVVAGVRPEGLELAGEGGGSGAEPGPGADGGAISRAILRGRVEHLEWLGHETLAHVVLTGGAGAAAAGAARAIARLPGLQSLERGDAIALAIAPAALHVFPREVEPSSG